MNIYIEKNEDFELIDVIPGDLEDVIDVLVRKYGNKFFVKEGFDLFRRQFCERREKMKNAKKANFIKKGNLSKKGKFMEGVK